MKVVRDLVELTAAAIGLVLLVASGLFGFLGWLLTAPKAAIHVAT